MSTLFSVAASNAGQIGIIAGIIVFVLLFFKIIIGFIKFCFRHPILFIILLLCGGLGFFFSLAVGGALILAVVVGGFAMIVMNGCDN